VTAIDEARDPVDNRPISELVTYEVIEPHLARIALNRPEPP